MKALLYAMASIGVFVCAGMIYGAIRLWWRMRQDRPFSD